MLRRILIAGLLLTAATLSHADDTVMAGGKAPPGLTAMIGDPKQWDTVLGDAPATSASGILDARPDDGALRLTWNGKGEAQFFVALPEPRDLTALLEADGALAVVMAVHKAPRKDVTLRMGCGYPCAANADIARLLKALPKDQWVRVSFDLRCFAQGGLDITRVDTPLLISSKRKLGLSIADALLVEGLGPEATIKCRD